METPNIFSVDQLCRLYDILNECTKKKFPELKVDWGHNGTRVFEGHGTVILQTEKQNECVFDVKEFKQFTMGCQNICEWIEGQNNE